MLRPAWFLDAANAETALAGDIIGAHIHRDSHYVSSPAFFWMPHLIASLVCEWEAL
jgi:hypothetical protein